MSYPTGPPATPPTIRYSTSRPGDLLARLGGADKDLLPQIGRSRVHDQFVAMALVLLATACLAVLSMGFAMADGLDAPVVVAVVLGLVWGFVILCIDRALILNLVPKGGFLQVAGLVVPRILLAALLGVVVSTPLVLRVFHDEIAAEVFRTSNQANTDLGIEVAKTADGVELARVRALIDTHEKALKGEIPAVDTPETAAQQEYLTQAEAMLASRREVSDKKYREWQCELYGAGCEGSTTFSGDGPLAQAREREYRTALADTNAAQSDVNEARQALERARIDASNNNADALRQAQERARIELPDLLTQRTTLETKVNDVSADGTLINLNNDGILAQLRALGTLGDRDSVARWAHITVGLLFFMIELLPVLVKIMTGLGAASLYDRVRQTDDDQAVEDAKIRQRQVARELAEADHRAEADIKSQRTVEDDMRTRERGLAIDANTHVEREMRQVLDQALAQWSADVRRALANGQLAPSNFAQSAAAPPPANGASPLQGRTSKVRRLFNLPGWGNP